MPIAFNLLLREAGLDLGQVRLLRHADAKAAPGHSPYELWRDQRDAFDLYQSIQSPTNRSKLNATHWISFVVTPRGETLFAGLYQVKFAGPQPADLIDPCRRNPIPAGTLNSYELQLDPRLQDFIGKLSIDWGPATRVWIQRPAKQEKIVTELRTAFEEPSFPGFLNFIEPLSRIQFLPKTWTALLQNTKGVYLLTCPRTRELYVGSATGTEGFWPRWLNYAQNGHGGNIVLRSRDASDYQVSILEVAGSAVTDEEILMMEVLWKMKLQSKAMGLNAN